jgi:hypothetical protein
MVEKKSAGSMLTKDTKGSRMTPTFPQRALTVFAIVELPGGRAVEASARSINKN